MSTPAPLDPVVKSMDQAATKASEVGAVATPMTAGSGALGALLGLATFTYNIIKEHGSEITFSSTDAGPGVSNVPADLNLPLKKVRQIDHYGVWYTHIRAWSSTIHSLYSHEAETEPKKFSSSYLCTVFPYKVTYAIAIVDVLKFAVVVAEARQGVVGLRKAMKQRAAALLAEQSKLVKEASTPTEMSRQQKAALALALKLQENLKYASPTNKERIRNLVRELYKDTPDAPAAVQLANDISTSFEVNHNDTYDKVDLCDTAKSIVAEVLDIPQTKTPAQIIEGIARPETTKLAKATKAILREAASAELQTYKAKEAIVLEQEALLADLRQTPEKRKYMTGFQLVQDQGAGPKSKVWQNVKIKASFTVSAMPTPEDAPGIQVTMDWKEAVIGYSHQWTGTMRFYPGNAAVGGEGRPAKRFNQFSKVQIA